MCTSLTTLHIPDGVTEIGWGAFKGCTSLTSLDIPDSVTKIRKDAFKGCKKLSITCATKEQEAMIRKSGFEGPINIAPQILTRQADLATVQAKGIPKKTPTV